MKEIGLQLYLRSRKHRREPRNGVGSWAAGECFYSFFKFSQNYHGVRHVFLSDSSCKFGDNRFCRVSVSIFLPASFSFNNNNLVSAPWSMPLWLLPPFILTYYMDRSVLLKTKTLVESINHYIQDPSGIFSVCHFCEWHIGKWRHDSRLYKLCWMNSEWWRPLVDLFCWATTK